MAPDKIGRGKDAVIRTEKSFITSTPGRGERDAVPSLRRRHRQGHHLLLRLQVLRGGALLLLQQEGSGQPQPERVDRTAKIHSLHSRLQPNIR